MGPNPFHGCSMQCRAPRPELHVASAVTMLWRLGRPDRMSEKMPDEMPNKMPERMSEQMPDRMSEKMPGRMPERTC